MPPRARRGDPSARAVIVAIATVAGVVGCLEYRTGADATGSGAGLPSGTIVSTASPIGPAPAEVLSTGDGTSARGTPVPVVGVIDGDTIRVLIAGVRVKIRLIGVDTPETHKPDTAAQCFGPQATNRMRSLVQHRSVRLQADPSQGDKDKYGRLLRYVYTADGLNLAQVLVAGGFGREYTYDTPYRFQAQFRAAQAAARRAHAGLWGACAYFGVPLARHAAA